MNMREDASPSSMTYLAMNIQLLKEKNIANQLSKMLTQSPAWNPTSLVSSFFVGTTNPEMPRSTACASSRTGAMSVGMTGHGSFVELFPHKFILIGCFYSSLFCFPSLLAHVPLQLGRYTVGLAVVKVLQAYISAAAVAAHNVIIITKKYIFQCKFGAAGHATSY